MRELGFGIIGCSRIAAKHAEALAHIEQAQLVAVMDIDEARAKEYAEAYGCEYYTKLDDILGRPDIQVVNICTPNGLHAEQGIKAARAGKHILVEKPVALTLESADALIEACEQEGVKLGVVHQNRFLPPVLKAREALERGRFGRLTHGQATVRWNRNQEYYDQADWRGTREMDGGMLLNQAIHNLDLLQWFMGPVESVFGYAGTKVRNIETEDVAVAVVRFDSGAFGVIEAATTIYPKNLEERLSIFGETGTVVIGGTALSRVEAWEFPGGEEEREKLVGQGLELPRYYGHQQVILDMIDAVRNDRRPAVDGREARKVLELILAIYESSKTGREVKLR
ncbi:Gfo/Idh/MocA family protein [Calderihabitans maritimus]|nr:Gfo/Idh/MocA family oxidoreductase [Calderihabitans maritimus]